MDGLDGGVRFFLLLIIISVEVISRSGSNFTDGIQDPVRWYVSEFGACSVACGGGIQVRTVRCVRTSKNYGKSEVKMPVTACPQPTPPITQSCNNRACVSHWSKGAWSGCSVTCGTGIQSRDVKCESGLRGGQRFQVAPAECGGSAPETSRKCHVTDCPFDEKSEPHSILSENYTLIQIRRTKKIKVNIGGQVNLLPGQTVVVKCPVKHYSKKLIYWSKGYKLIPFTGRVRNAPGGLYIGKADPGMDAGVYTCIAGDLTSAVTVRFVLKDDPSTKIYKKLLKQQYQKHPLSTNGKRNKLVDVFLDPDKIGYEELNQQRDQSHNSSHFLIYLTSDWSECSATTCGSPGNKKRKVSCSHLTPSYVKIVPDSECQRAGLEKPETSQECSAGENCAVWRTGPWSECNASCGETGHKSRLLTCTWQSTALPAWDACDLKRKPAVTKLCRANPCQLECTDSSRYCSLSRLLRLCKYHYFYQQCCLTCQRLVGSRIT